MLPKQATTRGPSALDVEREYTRYSDMLADLATDPRYGPGTPGKMGVGEIADIDPAFKARYDAMNVQQEAWDNARRAYEDAKMASNYQSPHWDDPNVLVHSRSQERRLLNPPPVDPTTGLGVDPAWKAALSTQDQADWERLTGPKGRMIENIQSDWHQAGAREGYQIPGHGFTSEQAADEQMMGGTIPVPDAPFKKSWPDLALKQELYSAAESPDISWVGITPGSESVKRGESLKPTFHDETLVNKLRDLLKPFGGEMGQGETVLPRNMKYTPEQEQLMGGPRLGPFDLAQLTPEMKEAIVKRGFPIMALLGLMKQRSNEGQ